MNNTCVNLRGGVVREVSENDKEIISVCPLLDYFYKFSILAKEIMNEFGYRGAYWDETKKDCCY